MERLLQNLKGEKMKGGNLEIDDYKPIAVS
jgi:hypothetical protein